MILGFPVLRLKGDYLAIVTLAFGEIIRLVLINWTEVSPAATFGVSGIPRPLLRHLVVRRQRAERLRRSSTCRCSSPIYRKIFLFYLILALALLTAYRHRCGCAACRSAAPGKRCARTRSPAARSASTR
jgi:branched-chain amino acid transport system permease protein